MDVYSEIDATINECVAALGSTLFTEWAGSPCRFFYTPGDPPFEVFQISVDPPASGRVAVFASAVDTNDDAVMEQNWEGPVDQLAEMLGNAVRTVNQWKQRTRTKPDPSSSW